MKKSTIKGIENLVEADQRVESVEKIQGGFKVTMRKVTETGVLRNIMNDISDGLWERHCETAEENTIVNISIRRLRRKMGRPKKVVAETVEIVREPVKYSESVILFENKRQLVLWNDELVGQISDGMWENTRPHDHWQVWSRAKALVAQPTEQLGRNFYAQKSNYNLNSSFLLDCVGDRMVESVQKECGIEDYDMKALRKDLAAMKKVIRARCDR